MQDSILNIEVSCFADYNTPDNPRPVNLLQWLTSPKYASQVNAIRSIADKEQRDRMKATLPAITPSGLFTRRSKEGLIRHSGLIQFDIDLKGNESIRNYGNLKNEICKIPNVAYCGLSVSGKGFWGLIPIEDCDKHYQYFKLIEEWFKDKGLIIDKAPKSVSSLRGYAYDPNGYFNHKAEKLKRFYIEPPQNTRPLIAAEDDVFHAAQRFANERAGLFIDGNRHNYVFHLCSYLNYRGITRSDAEGWIYENLLPANDIKSNCISYPFDNYAPGETNAIKNCNAL